LLFLDDKPESVSAFIPTVDTGELLAPPTVATPSKALLKTAGRDFFRGSLFNFFLFIFTEFL
jgi:hypothetical protein